MKINLLDAGVYFGKEKPPEFACFFLMKVTFIQFYSNFMISL
jgi:hypothetical protein